MNRDIAERNTARRHAALAQQPLNCPPDVQRADAERMARLEAGKGDGSSIDKIAYGIVVLSMYAIPVSYLMGGATESASFIISLVLSMAWFGKEGLKSWLITNIAVVASDVSCSSCTLSIIVSMNLLGSVMV